MHRNACYLKLVKTYRPWSKSFYTKKFSLKKINWAGEYLCDQICQNFSRQLISFSKTGHSRSLFSYFHLFNTVDSQKMFILNFKWFDANRKHLVSEATALATEPQPVQSLFLYFCLFNTIDSKWLFFKKSTMTWFELETSGVGSHHSANWATPLPILFDPEEVINAWTKS